MSNAGTVRPLGSQPRPSPREPPRRRWMVLSSLAIVLFLILIAGNPSSESKPSAISVPPLPPEPPLSAATILVPKEPVAKPLDDIVTGFRGTLVMTVGGSGGTEVWRWSSGPDGTIARSLPVADIYDAMPDPSGSWILGLRRSGREPPLLQMGIENDPAPVFWWTRSFAWHVATPGRVAWAAQRNAGAVATVHVGERVEAGIYFKPATTLKGFELVAGTDRLVAFDDFGFVFERWAADRSSVSVQRIGPTGEPEGLVVGQFVGISPDGMVAVLDGPITRLLTGPSLEESAVISSRYTSVVWAPHSARFAASNFETDSVDLADGSARRTVAVGDIGPTILAWSSDGRFVLVSGELEEKPVIVFIDAVTLGTWTVRLDSYPVAATVIP